ncbi:HIT family protein [Candidatus Woesearchaeota archaeon]|nr:HIT family protein [Candidatus Woesearchaeota archaeon]
MKQNCKQCHLAHGTVPSFPVYEDNDIVVLLCDEPSVSGHMVAIPKEHFPILEVMPDPLAGKLFAAATKVSSALFEHAQGMNVIVQNGISAGQDAAHVQIHLIPRAQNDNINFNWMPKQLSEEEMNNAEFLLKEQAKSVFVEQEHQVHVLDEHQAEEIHENFQVKRLRRMP